MFDNKKKYYFVLMFLILQMLQVSFASAQTTITSDHLTLRGDPLNKKGWTHFSYVNPQAPKGGTVTLHATGTYDNFHRYALRGSCAAGYEYFYDTLMTGSGDESDVLYPLIASRVEYAADYSFVIFDINTNAKDQDGNAITAEDAAFSFNIIFEKGVPQFRSYYAGVTVKALSGNRVRFDLDRDRTKEKIMALAGTTVFPKRYWQDHDFSEPLITPPLGTGAYRVKDYKMGQYVVLERVKNYWAADLPVNKGQYNFDTIRYDYYRDTNVAFEAFKAGEYDFRQENSASNWATAYNGKLFENGTIVREEIEHEVAQGMTSLVFNIQRPIFSDRRIRAALNYFFDFEWMNKNLFYNQYKRARSYFQNTRYEAKGIPSDDELRVLEPLRGKIPNEVFTTEYNPPVSTGDGYIRNNAREAMKLFKEAGWELKKGKLVNVTTGEPFEFELLIYDNTIERYAIPYQRNLERYGITMRIRNIDVSQYINRLRSRDFDLLANGSPAFQAPSSELMVVWHSQFIDSTWNTPGVTDDAVDYLTEQIAANQEDDAKLLTLGRALDRVLTLNIYCVPQWYLNKFRLAYIDKFDKPNVRPKYDVGFNTWWVK
ncbi:ABC transporter substrate-binding protein [Spirochaetia bacterium]|nr:ABC transporter substrate-binding protein [Spirochaetia bacterium]